MAPNANDPESWRSQAEEARAIAVQMTDAHTKAMMLSTHWRQRLAMRKTLIFIVILSLIVAAIFALVLVVPILHIG